MSRETLIADRARLEQEWRDAFNALLATPEYIAVQGALNRLRDHEVLFGDLDGPEPVGILNAKDFTS